MSTWYYSKGGQQLGPVTAEQMSRMVAQGVVTAGDLVWQEGMAQWEPASSVFGGARAGQTAMSYATPMPGESRSQKTLAILGIVFGCLSLIFCPLFLGVGGIVCAGIAVGQDGPDKKLAKISLGVAITGTVLGFAWPILFVVMRKH